MDSFCWSKLACCKAARGTAEKDDGEWMEPVLPKKQRNNTANNSTATTANNDDGKKEDATKQANRYVPLKKEKSIRWGDGKDTSARWGGPDGPTKEKSIRWTDVVDNLDDASADQVSSSQFDKEVVDSVMNSVMRDDYKPRGSMATMGSLFSEDSVSRGLGGFHSTRRGSDFSWGDSSRGTQESWGDLEDDEAIPVIMNVGFIGSITSAIRKSLSIGSTTPRNSDGSGNSPIVMKRDLSSGSGGASSVNSGVSGEDEAPSQASSSVSQNKEEENVPETTPEVPTPDTSDGEEAPKRRRPGWSF